MRSPINIALVKYWGKAHEKLIIPTNDSISLTVSYDLCSETRIKLGTIDQFISQNGSNSLDNDELIDDCKILITLNGQKIAKISDRIKTVVEAVRKLAQEKADTQASFIWEDTN